MKLRRQDIRRTYFPTFGSSEAERVSNYNVLKILKWTHQKEGQVRRNLNKFQVAVFLLYIVASSDRWYFQFEN